MKKYKRQARVPKSMESLMNLDPPTLNPIEGKNNTPFKVLTRVARPQPDGKNWVGNVWITWHGLFRGLKGRKK